MTKETDQLADEISRIKKERADQTKPDALESGYNMTLNLLTDLFGCVLIGLALGLFVRYYLNGSVLWVAGLTILGGIAGLWTVARYALGLGKKEIKK